MFTLRLTLTLLFAALAAALIAPFIAPAIARAGFHFPFPRIFDRVVMVTLLIAILWEHRELGLLRRLRAGFARLRSSLPLLLSGIAIGGAAIGILWGLAWLTATLVSPIHQRSLMLTLASNVIPALVIALIEEGFFRAFLLDGMAEDFGRGIGLAASSGVYAASHLVRSPARFEVSTIHPLAGLQTLAGSLAELGHPVAAAPGLLGLFLLGLLLGLAFLKSGRVYFSIGLHASVIVGAKTWRKLAPGAQSAPAWLSGYGRQPLISGAAAWLITLALLIVTAMVYHSRPDNSDDRLESLSHRGRTQTQNQS
jgi:uncharacterized protein